MGLLSGCGHEIGVAENHIPRAAGLYAVHADPETRKVLGLAEREAGVPLYVGKSEYDLLARDLNTHFAVGRGTKSTTGSSTVRRSLAALLREPLELRAVPRDKSKPNRF